MVIMLIKKKILIQKQAAAIMWCWRSKLRQPKLAIAKRWLSAALLEDQSAIVVHDDAAGKTRKYPTIWLRDNCQCSTCFHAATQSRQTTAEHANIGLRVANVATVEADNLISIDWSDKHQSTFQLAWLRARDFSTENSTKYLQTVYKPLPQLWSKQQFAEVTKNFEFTEVIAEDAVLLAWLRSLAVQGFSIIKNAPSDINVVRQLANRIGYIKRTTYGEVFEVTSKPNASNYAYLMTQLPLHTDMPYFEYKAGINILHCLVQSQMQGGENLITDGFYVAEQLRLKYPEYFDILIKTPVNWFDIGQDSGMKFHNIWRAPVVCLDVDRQYHRINHNVNKRDSHFNIPFEQINSWYQAYDMFLKLAYSETVTFKTVPGDVFVFNNLRMLHGRTAYVDSAQNKRHLVGAYVDWDLIYSKMRILENHSSH